MKRFIFPVLVGFAVALLYVATHYGTGGTDTVEYQGEQFKMSKKYWSYEDYKDDPNNLNTNELDRIEKVMTTVEFPSSFETRKEFIHSVFKLRFPGYGVGGIGSNPQTDDGSMLIIESVEIPQRDKDRYLVAREYSGQETIIDDFVFNTTTNAISNVKMQGGKLFYYDEKNSVVREKDLSNK